MRKVFDSMESADDDIIESCLVCLREISTQEYDSIQYYFEEICQRTSAASTNQENKVGAQAFEFWTTLVEDETERRLKNVKCYNYVASCSLSLIEMILQGLTIINFEDDEDEDDWGHSVSAGCCL
jgi:importin subunit beta-1